MFISLIPLKLICKYIVNLILPQESVDELVDFSVFSLFLLLLDFLLGEPELNVKGLVAEHV
jgi:hypothetical protein